MKVAVLALQGAFVEHQHMLARLGVDSYLIRNLNDWNYYLTEEKESPRLIIPGGESTAMLRVMKDERLMTPLRNAILKGMPVFGTCAGMIILAKEVDNEDRERLGTMDIVVHRNAYGRQLGSFHTTAECEKIGFIPMTFIRAPYIIAIGKEAMPLATVDGNIVAAQQGNQLVCSFHPELDNDTRFHQYFLTFGQ